ncbi:sigma factor-like helix-turn-helix DNA-binding protein [Gloeobacter morelensis]|uniref:sigma factor-like helix-turn-helix DNA-binding protein n=1 Tax=Gloeobacter morelensis TaxID=2907343 RepID=UPI001E3C6214|nr:sigma factor-like helix-turn-helix DNA-binding protein [Gloeobacter morelensis]
MRREQYVGPWLPEPLAQATADPLQQSELIDSLSMAFLVLLESLSPLERAVFLLSEVFEYDHAEIARIVEKSPVNCRQILRRARRHLAERQPRFRSSRSHSEKLVARFLQACSGGDLEGLLAVLAPEVTLVGDGGGKVAATLRPLQGAARVARFFVALRRRVGHFTLVPTVINGQPGIAFLVAGNLHSAMTFDIAEAGIRTIYGVRNPDKLQRFAQSLGMPLPH